MNKQKLIILIVAITIPIFLIVIWSKNDSRTEEVQHEEKVIVKTVEVKQKEISLPIHTSGKLSSKAEMKLSFKIGGIIEHISVDEGQRVKKGQLLAKLDLSEIEAQANQARSGFEKAKRDFARVKKLYADSVATLEQMQDATTGLEIARSNMKVAEFNLRHSAIYAPADGKILKRFVETNEMVGPGTPVFIFGSAGRDWVVRVGVTDRDVIQLQLNDPAFMSFDAYPEIKFDAQVSEIAEAADPMSGTYEVELKINQGNHRLISGFVAKVDIVPVEKQHSFIIPIEAFMEGDGNRGFVYTLEPNKQQVKKIPVKIGSILDNRIAVTSGLENVSKVITEGAPYLSDGCKVQIEDGD